MIRIGLFISLLSTAAWAQGGARNLSVHDAVRAALEARAELPRELPRFPSFVEARPQAPAIVGRDVREAAHSQGVAKGLERAQKAREKALERLGKQVPPGQAKKAEKAGVSQDARETKSKERIPGPPAGKGNGNNKGNSNRKNP